jgi:hypothetical protein
MPKINLDINVEETTYEASSQKMAQEEFSGIDTRGTQVAQVAER